MVTTKVTDSPCNAKAKTKARLNGESYKYKSVDQYGVTTIKKRDKKSVGNLCTSVRCEKSKEIKCSMFSVNDTQMINSQFWNLATWEAKKMYVISHIKRDVGYGRVRKSNKYYLSNNNNEKVQVCRSFFLQTLSLGEKTVEGWLKQSLYGMIVTNKINKSNNATNSKKDKFLLHAFLSTVEKLPSHYGRSRSKKLYINHKYKSLREIFDAYCEFCTDNYTSPCSRTTFEQFFYSSNLSLFVPKKDQCNRCVAFNNKVLDENEYKDHIERKEQAKLEKERDKIRALKNEITMLTNDAQATKPCPKTEANVMYFHLKLSVHNNTVFNVSNKQCKNYFYTEMDAPSSASTFISCITDFIIKNCINSDKKDIVIWCDNCSHQNKNVKLSNALVQICIRYNINITLKYLEVGHTFLECDSVHSLLERSMKNVNIYHPNDYVKLAKSARKTPTPYEAELMSYDFFSDYAIKSGQFYTSLRPPKEKNSSNQCKVNDFVAIKHDKEGKIYYKTSHTEDFSLLKTKPKIAPKLLNYPRLNNSTIKLESIKYDHLQKIKKTLPAYVHQYYDELPHECKKKKLV